MAAITSLSDLVTLLTNGSAQHCNVFIDNRIQSAAAVNTVVGQFTSLWRYNKSNGANGGIPPATPGEAPTRDTLGALRHTNAASGKQLWLTGVETVGTQSGTFVLYDRLYHIRGLSGSVNTVQAVGGVPTRNVGGEGNQIWLEIHSAIGTTATTVTANYTNMDGLAGQVTPATAIGGTGLREAERLIRLPLADGDTGVRSVQSITLAASTAGTGDFGVLIIKQLTRGFIEGAATMALRDLLSGIPATVAIDNDACLALAWHAGSTLAPRLDFTFHAVEK